jgi:hypothetical protein
MLLDLEREQEQRFVSCLDPAERESARDTLAHVIGAKWRMCDALAALRAGGQPDPSHDRDEVVRAYAGQEFASLEADAARVADALGAEVEALDAGTLASSPGWIGEATLADEIVQQCATHGMVIVFEGMCERGGADDARRPGAVRRVAAGRHERSPALACPLQPRLPGRAHGPRG